MQKKSRVLILGDGRIGRVARHYFSRSPWVAEVSFVRQDQDAKKCDLLIGALAGELGQRGLELALKHGKSLLDISDIDPPFYVKKKKEIEKKGILVIPGCGFSPGLVNLLIGKELSAEGRIRGIGVKAGSLSRRQWFFPFLWCFEDLILEHSIPSWQIVRGQKKRYPPFASYMPEHFNGIEAESYLCASGFENVMQEAGVRNFTCRVLRPRGFMAFFRFLQNHGFLTKKNLPFTKTVAESVVPDNLTVAQIAVERHGSKTSWTIVASSRKQEAFNSMQKITASVPAVIGSMLAGGVIRRKGLVFMHELGKDEGIVQRLLQGLKGFGVTCKRMTTHD